MYRTAILWVIGSVVLASPVVVWIIPSLTVRPPLASGRAGERLAAAPIAVPLHDLQLQLQRHRRWKFTIEPRIALADEACSRSIDKAVTLVAEFLQERKSGARPFAEEMLAFRSKRKLIRSKLPPWLGGYADAHRDYLVGRFHRRLFTDEMLQRAVELSVTAYLAQVQTIENRLLVDIRADLEDVLITAVAGRDARTPFQQRFETLVADTAARVDQSLGLDVTRETASWVAGDVAAGIATRVLGSVAARLGVSGGILGAGATASWATFGLSVVAAVVVDQIVTRTLDWAADPVGKLQHRVERMLGDTGRLIIEGDGQTGGLRAELTRLDRARAQVRREALHRLALGE